MSEMMRHFVDVDGNFVQQFQTTAFDSRIWELYGDQPRSATKTVPGTLGAL